MQLRMAVLASRLEHIIRRSHHVSVRDNQGRVHRVRPKRSVRAVCGHGSRDHWNEAEGNPLADRNPYVGPQAVGEGVFARLLAAIDNFTAVPSTFIDGGDHVVVLGRYGGTMKDGGATLDFAVLPRLPVPRRQGRDVPAVHRHRTVGAVDDIAVLDSHSRSFLDFFHRRNADRVFVGRPAARPPARRRSAAINTLWQIGAFLSPTPGA